MRFWPIYLALISSAIGCAVAIWFGVVASVGVGVRFLDTPYDSYPPDVKAYLEVLSGGVILAGSIFILQLVAMGFVYLAYHREKHLTRNCSGSNFAALN